MKTQEFIHRKLDHLQFALQVESQSSGHADWDDVGLIHDSLPDLNLPEVSIAAKFLSHAMATPFFIAGMTAGHADADAINERLAKISAKRGWILGLGSQRRELDFNLDEQTPNANQTEFTDHSVNGLHKKFPALPLISNLGLAQLIGIHARSEWNKLQDVVSRCGASVLAIHLNPLQEAIQTEGTPNFKGGMRALETMKKNISLPWMLKETGSGMSESFLKRVQCLEPFAVDVSGLGGTHWGRVEGLRAHAGSIANTLGQTFGEWGVGTLASVANAKRAFAGTHTEIWASGGVRNGLDAAKALASGATRVGFAKSALSACLQGEAALEQWMQTREAELRTALFCTNSADLSELDPTKIKMKNWSHHG